MLGSVDEVVVACREPRQPAEFWASVLGGEVGERDPDWCSIIPPGWSQLSFQRVPEVKAGHYRLHIDVEAAIWRVRPSRLNGSAPAESARCSTR